MNVTQKVETLMSRDIAWPIHREGVRMIALKENCYLAAYLCPAGVWTCGWGETNGVTATTRWTQEQADEAFRESLAMFSMKVAVLLKVEPTSRQLAAMVSLAYNIGVAAFSRSTVLRLHNAGDTAGAARAFLLFNKARVNGVLVPLAGLTSRRASESALYLTPDPEAPTERMPQAVETETPIAKSPIAQAGAVTAVAGVATLGEQIALVKPVVEQAREVTVGTLGIPEGWFLPLVLIVAGAAAAYWRLKQRQQGWA
ncbi:COG3772 Phage-related lysozyme (muraminidase) [uncultured Caudovirales phage]|uniref:Endolysin n=1 Tax=uncultured Caudovirales phage TaxID=2100421 RepID=A0A6J5NJK8_9CAUD|nr:COG3772 Phage-related lysozyme (muraminidase) [uncultured Caudovirales phage]